MINQFLYKTRKSIVDAQRELGLEYVSDHEITLTQCNSCGIWLKPHQMLKDLDGLDICKDCYDAYGP